jgi:branched-chain amino acid transport system ATP-binding protein
MLEISNVSVSHGHIVATRDVSLSLGAREIVALIGPNGAGKTSTLRAISGLTRPSAGRITVEGRDITGWKPHNVVKLGVIHAPERCRVFPRMSVIDNLRLGAYRQREKRDIERSLESVIHRFPKLRDRMSQRAGTLSGGEQQMLAIGRALMARPRVLLLDEPSFGLAPMIVQEIGRIIAEINKESGVAVLLVEQNARLALAISTRTYVMEVGRIVLDGESAVLRDSQHVKAAYLGG